MKMILTSECEKCEYGSIDDSNKSCIKVKCTDKNKEYFFGQCVPCGNMRKRRSGEDKADE